MKIGKAWHSKRLTWCPSQKPPEAIIGNAPVSMGWLGRMVPMGPQAVLGVCVCVGGVLCLLSWQKITHDRARQ